MARKKKFNTKVLSIAAEQALEDLEACELDPQYAINMGVYHVPNYNIEGVCSVCLAGGVIAKRLGYYSDVSKDPDDFETDTQTMLKALDDLRCGYVAPGFAPTELIWELHRSKTSRTLRNCSTYYESERVEWKKAFRRMIKMLKRRGL